MVQLPLKPYLHIQGNYRFRARNAPDAPAHFYQGRSVYRLTGVTLDIAGVLHDKAKPGHGTVSFHPSLPMAAYNDQDDVLKLGDFEGNYLWRGSEHCLSSLISADGRHVWAVSRTGRQALRIFLYNVEAGQVLAQLDFPDKLVDSSVLLSDMPHSWSVTLELAAGQDGVMVYRLDWEGGEIQARELFPGRSYTTPAWRPDGGAFLTLENDESTLAWFSYPALEKISEEPPREWETEEEWENASDHYQICLPGDRCIVKTVSNRYYQLDPVSMERVGELVVPGFEPRPTCEVFQNQQEDRSPYGELACVERMGGLLVAYTWRGGDAKEDLLVFREKDIALALK